MISMEALARAGLTNKRLREILESKGPKVTNKKVPVQRTPQEGAPIADPGPGGIATLANMQRLPPNATDWDVNCFLTTAVRSESLEGQMRCSAQFDRFAAVDLAYGAATVNPIVENLMKLSMGHLSIEQLGTGIGRMTEEWQKGLLERDANGKVTAVNQPKLIEVSHNLVHSLVTRRVAALATEVYQQYPLLKYDPFSNNQTSRLVADVTTQLVEQMAGAYDYRSDYETAIRDASLYTTSFKFKARHWHVEKQKLPVFPPKNGAAKAGREAKPTYEDRIVREGVEFVIPHPSRVYYDISKPLAKLNSDTGPRWIGHWEIVRIGDVRNDPAYFNKDAILMDAEMFNWYAVNPAYFSQYYPEQILFPTGYGGAAALTAKNDRVANIGTWAQMTDDIGTVLTQHYKCVIPKKVGLGTYEHPVWLRFVMAANTTIIYAEIVGSAPASVNSYNASPGLLMSPSFGQQAMQFQQMLTNDLNRLVYTQYQGMVEIWALNKDGMTKGDVDKIVNQLKNPDFTHIANAVITYSGEKLAQIGQTTAKGSDRLTKIAVETRDKVREIFDSIVQTLAMAERLMFFSPQELGQVSPRTVTATEMKAVRDTTLGIRDFHLIGVKQQMNADKRIILDSYVAFGSDDLEVPVAERYEPAVIEAAGFKIVDDGAGKPPDGLFTLEGNKAETLGQFYNYTYSVRNTDDTPPDAVVGQGIAQVFEIIAKTPAVAEQMTLDQWYEYINGLMEKFAPGLPKLRVPPGVDGSKSGGGAVEQMQAQLQQILPQLGQALQQQQQQIQQIEVKQAETDAGMKAVVDALNNLTSAVTAAAKKKPERSTPKGAVSPTIPNGAPPLRGVQQARPVPAL